MFYVGVEGKEERRGVIKVGSVNNRPPLVGKGDTHRYCNDIKHHLIEDEDRNFH